MGIFQSTVRDRPQINDVEIENNINNMLKMNRYNNDVPSDTLNFRMTEDVLTGLMDGGSSQDFLSAMFGLNNNANYIDTLGDNSLQLSMSDNNYRPKKSQHGGKRISNRKRYVKYNMQNLFGG